MIYISPAIVLAPSSLSTLAFPAFLWESLVTVGGIAADREDANYPATNLANPQTSSLWKSGSTASQNIVFDIDPDQPVDGIGVSRHNFGSGSVTVKIYGIAAEPGAVWKLLAELVPGDDTPLFAIVEGGYYVQVKISLTPTTVAPQAATVYVGTVLRMPRGIPPGHTPIVDALDRELLSGIAENGDFLGDIITSQRLATTVEFRLLDGDWYRANMRPFAKSNLPFFFGWAPALYPHEMGFAKFARTPKPTISQATGAMDVSLQVTGLAL
jgi:hypothetical protein